MDFLTELENNGFSIIENVYSDAESNRILDHITHAGSDKDTFRKSADLFAIRQFFHEVPGTIPIVFNPLLKEILEKTFGNRFFVVKCIYFDKPASSNWFVSYHQDLTISVDKKRETNGFQCWTVKQNQFAVQPPLAILQNIVTVRIHLDPTNENNGALRVVPQSHKKGIYRPKQIDWNTETEVNCSVAKGGIMLMKPLLLHSSGRTTNNARRRVIHMEFSSIELPNELNWSERIDRY